MVSAVPSDRSDFRNSSSSQRLYGSNQADNWEARVDSEQMFQLIDTLLPFEACLYHQVLPLSIEKTNLHLGMVSPDDGIALEYVRRILTYVHYSLITHRLPNDVHQNMLSAYLNYVGKRGQQKPAKIRPVRPTRKVIDPNVAEQAEAKQPPTTDQQLQSNPSVEISSPSADVSDRHSPEPVQPIEQPTQQPIGQPIPTPAKSQRASFYQDDQATLITDLEDELPLVQKKQPVNLQPSVAITPDSLAVELGAVPVFVSESIADEPTLPGVTQPEIVLPPMLELNARYIASPIADLAKLPAKDLVTELLARVLAGGIGRLFFEQQQSHGRILWSQNGVFQAALEGLLPDQMHAIIDELKALSESPQTPLQTAQQKEIERIYQNARLLLRFRFMPGTYGEEATLQVLRGAALKFHQQTIASEQDLLGFAEQLQRKVDDLLDQAQTNPSVLADDMLLRLRTVVISLDEKLRQLEALNDPEEN